MNLSAEATAAGGIEAVPLELQLNLRPHSLQQGQKASRKKIEGRRGSIVGSAFNHDATRFRRQHESRKDGLKHQGPLPCRAHAELVFARENVAWRESQFGRAERRAVDFCTTDFGSSQYRSLMLTQQAGPFAACANLLNAK